MPDAGRLHANWEHIQMSNLPPGVTPADIENHDGERCCEGCGAWFRPAEPGDTHCPHCQNAEDRDE